MTDNIRPRWPTNLDWRRLVAAARLGSFEEALLVLNSRVHGERCGCVGSIRELPRESWQRLPWMDSRTHDRVVQNILDAANQEVP